MLGIQSWNLLDNPESVLNNNLIWSCVFLLWFDLIVCFYFCFCLYSSSSFFLFHIFRIFSKKIEKYSFFLSYFKIILFLFFKYILKRALFYSNYLRNICLLLFYIISFFSSSSSSSDNYAFFFSMIETIASNWRRWIHLRQEQLNMFKKLLGNARYIQI